MHKKIVVLSLLVSLSAGLVAEVAYAQKVRGMVKEAVTYCREFPLKQFVKDNKKVVVISALASAYVFAVYQCYRCQKSCTKKK